MHNRRNISLIVQLTEIELKILKSRHLAKVEFRVRLSSEKFRSQATGSELSRIFYNRAGIKLRESARPTFKFENYADLGIKDFKSN